MESWRRAIEHAVGGSANTTSTESFATYTSGSQISFRAQCRGLAVEVLDQPTLCRPDSGVVDGRRKGTDDEGERKVKKAHANSLRANVYVPIRFRVNYSEFYLAKV